jgi:hypothetical protein
MLNCKKGATITEIFGAVGFFQIENEAEVDLDY